MGEELRDLDVCWGRKTKDKIEEWRSEIGDVFIK